MRSSILVSKIVRAVETGGGVGDGAGLAAQYAEAVMAVNARLDAAQTAIDAGQASEAVRLMEEEPKLVGEVGALDLHQFAAWQTLCASRGWTLPPMIDQRLVDRLLEVYNSSAMLEPALKTYRKAMRTRDGKQIVDALRRLVELDPGNAEWGRDLSRAEAELQKRLAGDFAAAADDERREEIASDLLDAPWSASPAPAVIGAAARWRAGRNEERRAKEQSEDLDVLHKISEGTWSRSQAEAVFAHLDALAECGTPLKPVDAAFVDSLRARCAAEADEEAKSARWTELMEALHAAVEHASPDEIRRVMAAPEFLDRPPDYDLLLGAKRVMRNAEEERRRKTRRILAVTVLAIAAVAGISGKIYADRRFKAICSAEAGKLESIANAPRAHEALEKALNKLKEESPRVYASAEVSAYEARLETIRKDRTARIGRAEDAVRRLEEAQNGGWEGDAKLLEDQFTKAKADIRPEDEDLSRRLSVVQLDFEKVKGDRRAAAIAKAREELAPLVDEAKALVSALKIRFFDDALERNLRDFRDKVALWKTSHGDVAPAEASELDAAVATIDTPEKKSRDAAAALVRLNSATNATEALSARDALCAYYPDFQDVSSLRPLQYGKNALEAIVSGADPSMSRFRDFSLRRTSDADFAEFVEKEVLWMESTPTFFDVYGVDNGTVYVGFSVGGKAGMTKEDRSTATRREERCLFTPPRGGNLIDAGENQYCPEITFSRPPTFVDSQRLLRPCAELHDLVDAAKLPSADVRSFSSLIWKLFDAHIANSALSSYPDSETKVRSPMAVDRFPAYKRVQMLLFYKNLLVKMGELVEVDKLPRKEADIMRRIADLAAPVSVQGIPDELSWVCILDERVEKRNAECARFLASIPTSFGAALRASTSGLARLSGLSRWRAEFAGVLSFKPGSAGKCIPQVRPGVRPDHPLYVLRMTKTGRPFLRKLLVHGKAKDAWMIAAGRGSEWILGEPVFQVRDDGGNAVDAEPVIEKFLASLPESAAAKFNSEPFWIEFDRAAAATGKKDKSGK